MLNREDITWIIKLIIGIALVVSSRLPWVGNYWVILLLVFIAFEILIYWNVKKERRIRIINEMKKLHDQFSKFTYGSHSTSLPSIINALFADERFIKETKNVDKAVKVWRYYFEELRDNLSDLSGNTNNLLNSSDASKRLNEILRYFENTISRHYKIHMKFKEMIGDLGGIPQNYVEQYNKGVKEYNEFFRMLNKFVIDHEDIGSVWFKGKYFFDFIDELK